MPNAFCWCFGDMQPPSRQQEPGPWAVTCCPAACAGGDTLVLLTSVPPVAEAGAHIPVPVTRAETLTVCYLCPLLAARPLLTPIAVSRVVLLGHLPECGVHIGSWARWDPPEYLISGAPPVTEMERWKVPQAPHRGIFVYELKRSNSGS